MGLGRGEVELGDVDLNSMSDCVVVVIRLVSWRRVAGSGCCCGGGILDGFAR